MNRPTRRNVFAQVFALAAVLAIVLPAEYSHLRDALRRHWSDWFIDINIDTTLPFVLLLALPYFWFVRRPFWTPRGRWWQSLGNWWITRAIDPPSRNSYCHDFVALSLIIATSLWLSAGTSSTIVRWRQNRLLDELHRQGRLQFEKDEYRFGDLPPAYHDEFSYLFQAKTYLSGRLSYPSHPTAGPLFDQMHVVNEGQFASRYFPATGLFIAPWLWLGWPILGHWLAGAATSVFVFFIGRELSNNGVGFIAGWLAALSPGMALFGNLLLAHHPTLLGLSFFAWRFLRWLRTNSIRDVALAGIGLSWAMLCRPMTAAGFGLPFGIWFVARLCSPLAPREESRASSQVGATQKRQWSIRQILSRSERATLISMAVPLLIGVIILGIHNHAITGSIGKSPYQLFTDIYTPRHGYGFNNVVRGEQHLGPRVLDNYDRWAVNLTPALAFKNTKNRLIASWQWTMGIVPLLVATVVFIVGHVFNVPRALPNQSQDGHIENAPHDGDRRWWLIFAAIVSLFAVHVPYWFDGMFHWHYVFESGPLWCLLLAAATDTLARSWLATERPRMPVWWGCVILSAIAVNLTDALPFWFPSKLQAATAQVAYSRLRYQAFDELLQRRVTERPALVAIEADPSDRHIDYIVNDPDLSDEILRVRYPVPQWTLEWIAAEFPDRNVYLYRVQTHELTLVRRAR